MSFKNRDWGKTPAERARDLKREELAALQVKIKERSHLILSYGSVRNWDIAKLRDERFLLEQDQKEAEKIMRKLSKEGNLK